MNQNHLCIVFKTHLFGVGGRGGVSDHFTGVFLFLSIEGNHGSTFISIYSCAFSSLYILLLLQYLL